MIQQILDTKSKHFIGIIISIIALEVWLTTLLPQANGRIFAALSSYDKSATLVAIITFSVIAISLVTENAVKVWVAHRLALHLRENITFKLTGNAGTFDKDVSNIPARICDDVFTALDLALRNIIEIVISAFICLILLFQMKENPVLISGAIIYITVSLCIAFLFKKPLTNIQYKLADRVSSLRSSIHDRHIDEDGEQHNSRISGLFQDLKIIYVKYINLAALYDLYSSSQSRFAALLPIILVCPSYFSHKILIGQLMTQTGEFNLLVINACVSVILYPQIMQAKASWKRVKELL